LCWKSEKESNQKEDKRERKIEFEGKAILYDKLRKKERQIVTEAKISKKWP
jgi:hypothetical protein